MPITEISSAGSGVSNESIVTSSSLPTSTSTASTAPISNNTSRTLPNNPNQSTDTSLNDSALTGQPNQTKNISANVALSTPNLNNIVRESKSTIITEKDSAEAAKLFKILLNTQLKPFQAQNFTPGSMLFYRYDAKHKDKLETWDRSPLVFILRKSRNYLLTINLHYVPIALRIIFIKYFLQANKNNIRANMPLTLSYQMVKPVLKQLGMLTTIKLHIFSRVSRRGVVIPPEFMMSAAKLKAESFTNGISADQLYKQSLSQTRSWKGNRTRRDKVR